GIAAIAFVACVGLARAEIVIISNSATTIVADEVRDVFLGEKQFAGATKLQPIDNGPLQAEFQSKALKIEPDRYNSLWAKKSFRDGVNKPSVKSGDAEVIDFVKKTPGAVGYVAKSPSGVSVVQKY
ncbi:MAG TPA: hypothetical protein VJ001_13365, partial [Rhodocyclaceae bacterium]|nr:hypothetical protein [Rhodocyclaceae bacterium]